MGPSAARAPPLSRGGGSRDGRADGGGAAAALRGAGMEVFIPSFRYEESELERGYTVRCAGAEHARASRWPCAGGQRGLRWGAGQASTCRGRAALPAQASPHLPLPGLVPTSTASPALSGSAHSYPILPSLPCSYPALHSPTNPALQSRPSPALHTPALAYNLLVQTGLSPRSRALPSAAPPLCPKDAPSPPDTCCLTRALFSGRQRQWLVTARLELPPSRPAGSASRARPNTVKGLEYLLPVERLRELGLLILENKRDRGVSSTCTDVVNGQTGKARLFVLVPSDRRGGSGQTSEHSEHPLNIGHVIMRLVKHWHRLPRGL